MTQHNKANVTRQCTISCALMFPCSYGSCTSFYANYYSYFINDTHKQEIIALSNIG